MSFIIYSLPRSMSTWLSHFLYEKDRPVYHEKSQEFSTPQQIKEFLNGDCGICDTGLLLLWRDFYYTRINTVLVVRDPKDVWKELDDIGLAMPEKLREQYEKALEEYDGPRIQFKVLQTKEGVKELCSLLNIEFDEHKYEEFKDTQIQPFVQPMVQRAKGNLTNCKALYKEYL